MRNPPRIPNGRSSVSGQKGGETGGAGGSEGAVGAPLTEAAVEPV